MKVVEVIMVILLWMIFLYYTFPLAVVIGRSMYPTLVPDQTIVSTRFFNRNKLVVGGVYIYEHDGKKVIKRLKYSDTKGNCYFLGDNSAESYDSRNYGFVNKKRIVAKVLWLKSNN